jgi:secreted PhoX family phosphatase
MTPSRRTFVTGAAAAAAFAGLWRRAGAEDETPEMAAVRERLRALPYRSEIEGYGPLVNDPAGIFDLPRGFTYQMISRAGEAMDDGFLVPGKADGMAAFRGPGGTTLLVRNHELNPTDLDIGAFGPGRTLASRLPREKAYDLNDNGLPLTGGTTTLVYDTRAKRLVSHHLSLAGTSINCAGGPTPRNTWLSCEETTRRAGQGLQKDHGYVFEVPARSRGLADPIAIRGMGRFRHEAAVTDPRTGIVYQTEDVADGLIYRFLPNDRRRLAQGGLLQALALEEADADCRNWQQRYWRQGEWKPVHWVTLDGPDAPDDDLRLRGRRAGAALFARGEGMVFDNGEFYAACTSGGPGRLGQVMRYRPSPHEGRPGERDAPGRIQLFVEPSDPQLFNMVDNLAVSPWGHLFACEDKAFGANQLKAMTPQGQIYTVGRNAALPRGAAQANTELAGVCFSPDGSTLFVNAYAPGYTLAITGPWRSLRS